MNAPLSNDALDAIGLQILRSRLEAMAEEGASTIERTACSPTIAESRDCSCSLLEAAGDLIVGGGAVAHHFGACSHAVKSTLALHGEDIAEGDVFIANDPHNGGGLHYMDVVVQRPIFHEGRLIAWVANSGHMIDVGGMAFGSWSPAATECFQEALRLPPVRLIARGREQADVWAILRNNIRVPQLVEMDIRSLMAGCQVVHDKMLALVADWRPERLIDGLRVLREASLREVRRRIEALEDGSYRYVTWTEWGDERFIVPCTMTIDGERMVFDFAGAAPQCPHFFNSKPHVIGAILTSDVTDVLAHDLPLSAAMFDAIEVRCPPHTVVNADPPAPTASAHFDVALNASMAAQQCLMIAIAISDASAPGRHLLSGPSSPSCMGLHTWGYNGPQGQDGWLMIDGAMCGGSAGHDRDGYDLFSFMVARKAIIESADIETFEARYPVLVVDKRPRPGTEGAGEFRAGAGCQMAYRPHKASGWTGVMLGMRERLPLSGLAGGQPGGTTDFRVHRADGRIESVPAHASGLQVGDGDVFEFSVGCGGGWGDPLDRASDAVERDLRRSRITQDDARLVYGVVFEGTAADRTATGAERDRRRRERLQQALPAPRPVTGIASLPTEQRGRGPALYPGVEDQAGIAYAVSSGAPLAVAPGGWTDGCPRLEEGRPGGVVVRSLLDPSSGRVLMTEATLYGEPVGIVATPKRWAESRPLRWGAGADTSGFGA